MTYHLLSGRSVAPLCSQCLDPNRKWTMFSFYWGGGGSLPPAERGPEGSGLSYPSDIFHRHQTMYLLGGGRFSSKVQAPCDEIWQEASNHEEVSADRWRGSAAAGRENTTIKHHCRDAQCLSVAVWMCFGSLFCWSFQSRHEKWVWSTNRTSEAHD